MVEDKHFSSWQNYSCEKLFEFTHLFTTLPKLNSQRFKQLEQVFFKHISDNKLDTVSRNTLQLDYEKGESRINHIDSYINFFKLT